MAMSLRNNPGLSAVFAEKKTEAAYNELKALIDVDFQKLKHDLGDLKAHATMIKQSFRNYHQCQSSAIQLRIKNACLDEATTLKEERNMVRVEVNEAISMINVVLEDEISEVASDFTARNVSTFETPRATAHFDRSDLGGQSTPFGGSCMSSKERVVKFLTAGCSVDHSGNIGDRGQRSVFLVGEAPSNLENCPQQGVSHVGNIIGNAKRCEETPRRPFSLANQSSVRPKTNLASGLVGVDTFVPELAANGSPGHNVHHRVLPDMNCRPPNYRNNRSVAGGSPRHGLHHLSPTNTIHNLPSYRTDRSAAPGGIVGSSYPYTASKYNTQDNLYPGNTLVRGHREHIDPASLHLLRQSLLKKSDNPYSGEPHLFQTFLNQFKGAIRGIPLDPWDIICILEARTTGKPQKLIQSYMINCSANPAQALAEVEDELREKFGSGSRVANTLIARIESFPQIGSTYQVDKLEDILELCKIINTNMTSIDELSQFNNSYGIRKIWDKLPDSLQNAWRGVNNDYKASHRGFSPSFKVFLDFLCRKVREFSDPAYEKSFRVSSATRRQRETHNYKVEAIDQSVCGDDPADTLDICVLHPQSQHELKNCKKFESATRDVKFDIMKKHRLCYRCLGKHMRVNCGEHIECKECGREHLAVFHGDIVSRKQVDPSRRFDDVDSEHISNLCTRACGRKDRRASCSKTLLVDIYLPGKESSSLRCYAVVDEQSSSSFADPKVAEYFGIKSPTVDYTLTTLAGLRTRVSGIQISGLRVRGVAENRSFSLPTMFTNAAIPDSRDEVASPDVVSTHPHVAHYARFFNKIDHGAETLLLLGRDCSEAMYTRCYGQKSPYAHRTRLGWALVGGVCAEEDGHNHRVMRTCIREEHFSANIEFPYSTREEQKLSGDSFREFSDDEFPGLSQNDRRFVDIVSQNMYVNEEGNITLPLPFKEDNPFFPDNRRSIFNRSVNTLNRIKRDTAKLEKCLVSMQANIDSGHVERVPVSELGSSSVGSVWYVPVFPVVHPRKEKIRLVFDSSAKFQDTSLNDLLLSGPDFNNKLRTVLLRFRIDEIAFSADVESMFYCFHLAPKDKDKTRFFWFSDNDPNSILVEYRARVHLFGNTSSPALAIMGLRYAVDGELSGAPRDVRRFIHNHFYVDDGLMSCGTVQEAVDIISGTKKVLGKFGIKLHKIASNSSEVLASFSSGEVSPSTRSMVAKSITQPTLGLQWDMSGDRLTIQVDVPHRPFTKRGVLSTINSLFDPLGFVAPIILSGRLIQRMLIPPKNQPNPTVQDLGWDDALPKEYETLWETWKGTLPSIGGLSVPRCYRPRGFGTPTTTELHIFSDASKQAVGFVAYLKSKNRDKIHVALVAACSRVSPRAATSIPRLELCAAVEAGAAGQELTRDLGVPRDHVTLYTDSTVVLGYLSNREKRFSGYVARRVDLITKGFPAEHWRYVSTCANPADIASRPQNAETLRSSCWFIGPPFLWRGDTPGRQPEPLEGDLPETVPHAKSLVSAVACSRRPTELANIPDRVGNYRKAIEVCRVAIDFALRIHCRYQQRKGVSLAENRISCIFAEMVLVRECQLRDYGGVVACLSSRNPYLQKTHPLAQLSPFMDQNGVLRVGGRLKFSGIDYAEKFPIVISNKNNVAKLVIRLCHEQVRHQGRVITQSAICDAGFFIQHGSRTVRSFIRDCVICSKLRGSFMDQIMSDLPLDRLERTPPFSNCGLDVFGPYQVTEGSSTRRSSSTRKCWVLLFTCLVSRAVHLEPLPALDISAFKNAFRRFTCVRGHCNLIRSDRGTNFVGAFNQDASMDIDHLKNELQKSETTWLFNPPKASHFGGVFERKIGSVRRVIDACVLLIGKRLMTRDEFNTFLSESASIVNNTPLTSVSLNPNDPLPITPAMLLLQREDGNRAPVGEFSKDDLLSYGPKRWRRIQSLSDAFWHRWRTEYLQSLTTRKIWTVPRRSLAVGDVVLIRDQALKRNSWPMGRVKNVKKSQDGHVRSATLLVPCSQRDRVSKECVRPISQLVLLIPVEQIKH